MKHPEEHVGELGNGGHDDGDGVPVLDPERGEAARDSCSAGRQVRKAHPRFALAAVEASVPCRVG